MTVFIITFFFLEMVYPHHRVVFKRATVEDPERVLHLSPDATGVIEAGRLAWVVDNKLEQFPDN